MTAQPDQTGRPTASEVSSLIAWARRLSNAGIGGADPAELAAFHHAKQTLIERITAHQPQDQTRDPH